jgi:hypothetical protein
MPLPLPLEPAWSSPYTVISVDSSSRTVVMNWLDHNPSAEFRRASEELLRIVQDRKLIHVLHNTEDLRVIGLSDQCWVRENFLPRLHLAGVRVIAMVHSLHYWTRVGMLDVMKGISFENLTVEYFNSVDQALEYLRAAAAATA